MFIEYNGMEFEVWPSKINTTIFNSYRITSMKDMKNILNLIREKVTDKCSVHTLSLNEMVNEWRVHNLLYCLGLFKDKTQHVDLNTNKTWYGKLTYFILSPFYFHFF